MKYLSLILAGLTAICFTSCDSTGGSSFKPSTHPGGGASARYFSYDRPAKKPSNPNNVRVKISLKNQMVYVMEGNEPLLIAPASVGKAGTPTPRGNFRAFNKEHYRRANTHGFAYTDSGQIRQTYLAKKPAGWKFKGTPMPYWVEFTPAYGIHAGWMKDRPCTHGCIRLHVNVAPKFFALVKSGTPINIAYSQPEDATIGRNIPRPPDAGPLPDYYPQEMLKNNIFTDHKPVKFQ
ncbi:L,D-transpeptidase [Persicirhabdus sediminis]|uniref:L,D-transpeptidase n=1 Tax=Persicirhabdus sediminis TaxID=454144 RepID=A0A8J7SLZ4_9BACT|nr:L,D-transpeptidase [Persicirhabdus sediminis]MBK1791725.1 L,D-transpeptidase [Persicirhabdus sediminis]